MHAARLGKRSLSFFHSFLQFDVVVPGNLPLMHAASGLRRLFSFSFVPGDYSCSTPIAQTYRKVMSELVAACKIIIRAIRRSSQQIALQSTRTFVARQKKIQSWAPKGHHQFNDGFNRFAHSRPTVQ
eukprot:416126-Pelagomonas_calceolata.AAC.2